MSSNLAISLVIGASVGAAVSGINQVKNSLKALTDSSKSISERMDSLSKLSVAGMKSSVASLTALGGSVVALAKPAIEFESAMADVKKVVGFKTPDGFKKLSKDLLDLTDTIPMTANELAAIAASGGQLGVAEEDIKSFTTTIAKMSVAFDMSADASGDAMAKLANVYKIPIGEIGKLGDAINDLSNSSPAKASDIVNVLSRIGGTAKQFGLAENAAASLSSTFISLGKSPEVAGTAINGMLTKLMTAEKGGKAFQASLKKMGLSAKTLKQNIAKDGEGAIVDFIKRVEKLPKDQAMGILVDIFGREYADDVAVLAGNVDLLEKSLNRLKETDENGNLRYLGSMEAEFAERAKTTEASLTKLKNGFVKVGISIGNYVLPVINKFVDWFQPILLGIADWINANSDLMGTIAEIATYIVAGIAGFSALTGVVSGVIFVLLKLWSGAQLVWSVLAFGGNILLGIGNVIVSVAGFIGKLLLPVILKLAHGFGYMIGLGIKLGLIIKSALISALGLLKTTMLAVGRIFMANPIGFTITAIAVGAYLVYQYWEPIKAFFINLWSTITPYFANFSTFVSGMWNGITGIWSAIWNGVVTWFTGLWKNIKSLFSGNFSALGNIILAFNPLSLFQSIFSSVLNWFGIDLTNSFTEYGANLINGLVNGIRNAWNGAKDWVVGLGQSIKGWFTGEMKIHSPSRVFMGYGDNIVEGLAIGIAKTAVQATNAVSNVANNMQETMPKKITSPVIDTANLATSVAKKAIGLKIKPTAQPLVKKVAKAKIKPETLQDIKPKPMLQAVTSIPNFAEADVSKSMPKAGFLAGFWDKVTHLGSSIGGWFKGLDISKTLRLGSQMLLGKPIDLGFIHPQNNDTRTPSFNPNAKLEPFEYQSLQRIYEERQQAKGVNGQNGIVVHFNPTIQLNGNQAKDDILNDLQQGLNMSLMELKRLIIDTVSRENDQYRRRAY